MTNLSKNSKLYTMGMVAWEIFSQTQKAVAQAALKRYRLPCSPCGGFVRSDLLSDFITVSNEIKNERKKKKMKTNSSRFLSFVIVLCVAFSCFVAPVPVTALEASADPNQPAVASTGTDYVETEFGEGKLLITTVHNGTSYYLPATTTSSAPTAKVFTSVSDIPTDDLWTVTSTGTAGQYYIQNSAGNYLYTTSSNNGVRVGSTKGTWLYGSDNSLKYTSTSRFLGVYTTNPDWRCYTTVNASNFNCNDGNKNNSQNFVFYKINEAAPVVTVEGDAFTTVGTNITLTAELANVTGDITWDSTDKNVATVVDGVVTPVAMGKTTITATVNDVVGTKEIVVFPIAGELTIAQALEVCTLTGTTNAPNTYSVTGTVKSIDDPYDSGYGNITVTVTDGTDSIKAFRMAGGSDLAIGDLITVSGTLVNYNGNTPEFIQGCTYVKVVDETLDAVRAALNEIQAYASLGFRYSSVIETVDLPSEVTDTLNRALTGVTSGSTSYSTWSGKTVTTSDAVYAGNSAGSNDAIQLRSNNSNSGIVTTVSGGKATKIVVTWNSNTSAGRTLNVYGSNTAYSAATDLYDSNKQGTLLGTIVCGTSTELVIDGDYAYIGMRSASSAMYLDNVSITWNAAVEGGATEQQTVLKDSKFSFRFAVDGALADIENVDAYGIQVKTSNKTANYTEGNATSWTVENGQCYVTVNLGDIINSVGKLGREFTVTAFVEVDGMIYTSEQTITVSVASIVAEYYEAGEDVEHLYNHLVELGLI